MPIGDQDYYQKQSEQLGWGESQAKLDEERVGLLNKYLVGPKVLDVGCGLGIYVDYLTKQNYKSWGVDFVKEFIDQAKKKRHGNFLLAKAEKLPFKKSELNSIILFDILEHGDDLKILLEAKRVSRDRILVIVPRQVDDRLSNSGVVFRHYLDKSHMREYTPEMLEKLANQANLKVVELLPIHRLNSKIIFLALFKGPILWRDICRKVVNLLLPYDEYPTEYFVVLDHK